MTEGGGGRELDRTPTWAVASICGFIVLISIMLEKILHHMGEYFTKRRKKAMFEALEKIKAELMILGFISLLLTFGRNYIIQICIPEEVAMTMLPCHLEDKEEYEERVPTEKRQRRLLWDSLMRSVSRRSRRLKEASEISNCSHGNVQLISENGLHQLHIFVFFLAVFHVIYSAITMKLGKEKIRSWKEWEKETLSSESNFTNDSDKKYRFTHETSFVKQHSGGWNNLLISFYIVSFFRQFFRSVRKADYLAMRHGFINVHFSPGSQFNFKRYIMRSLEDDFKVIVGISPILWASAVLFLLLNVAGWLTLFWISVLPLIIILSVGTKLQAIITQMAIDIKEKHAVIQGIPLVQLSDQHFWFARPDFVLFLIHFTLFQNAFQLIYMLWIWYEFGWDSCFQDGDAFLIARIVLGILVQILCSYITLPLYALVSQMGTHMKKTIFDDQTSKAIMKWHQNVKKKNPSTSTGDAQLSPREGGDRRKAAAAATAAAADTEARATITATASDAKEKDGGGSTPLRPSGEEGDGDDEFQTVEI